MIGTILFCFAIVFAAIAALFVEAVGGPPGWRVHFGWMALAFFLVALLLGGAHGLVVR